MTLELSENADVSEIWRIIETKTNAIDDTEKNIIYTKNKGYFKYVIVKACLCTGLSMEQLRRLVFAKLIFLKAFGALETRPQKDIFWLGIYAKKKFLTTPLYLLPFRLVNLFHDEGQICRLRTCCGCRLGYQTAQTAAVSYRISFKELWKKRLFQPPRYSEICRKIRSIAIERKTRVFRVRRKLFCAYTMRPSVWYSEIKYF